MKKELDNNPKPKHNVKVLCAVGDFENRTFNQIKLATKIGKSIVDESTGEMISPVEKTSTSGYKVTLAK